jgi:hypothetical protein
MILSRPLYFPQSPACKSQILLEVQASSCAYKNTTAMGCSPHGNFIPNSAPPERGKVIGGTFWAARK